MSTLKGKTKSATYDQLVKRQDSYSSTGNQIEIMNDTGFIQTTELYLDADNSRIGIGTASPGSLLEVEKSSAGATITSAVRNTDNSNVASHAQLFCETGGASGGDPLLHLQVDGVVSWSVGIDNSDSDKLKIGHSATVGTNTAMTFANSTGNVGIGTTSPGSPLTVKSSSDAYQGGIALSNTAGSNLGYIWMNGNVMNISGDGSPIGLTIDDSGKVGIGTASPSVLLDVEGTGATQAEFVSTDNASSYIRFKANGTANYRYIGSDSSDKMHIYNNAASALLTVQNNGYVGIGTTSPSALLEIASSTANRPSVYITNTSTSPNDEGGNIIFRTGDPDANLTTNDVLGDISFQGQDNSDNAYITGATIRARIDGTPGTDSMPTELAFYTNSGANSHTQQMCILANGNVGIGIDAPSELLDLTGGGIQIGTNGYGISFRDETPQNENVTKDGARIYFDKDFFASESDALVIEKTDISQADPDGGIVFANKGNDNVRETAMVIKGDGKVGIGTTAPGSTLEVASSTTAATVEINGNDGNNSSLHFTEEGHAQWNLQHVSSGAYATQGDLRVWDYSDSSVAAHVSPGDGVWQSGSDLRIKKDIENIDSVLSSINSLRPVTWKRKYGKLDKVYAGLVAQEVKPHFPLTVGGTEDSFKEIPAKDAVLDDEGNILEEAISLHCEGGLSIGYNSFVPYLIKAIQELSAKVDALENNKQGDSNEQDESTGGGDTSGQNSTGTEGNSGDATSASESPSDNGGESTGSVGSDSTDDSSGGYHPTGSPSSDWTKAQLKNYMDANSMSYNSGDTKDDLLMKIDNAS